jgi:hypothetical protein
MMVTFKKIPQEFPRNFVREILVSVPEKFPTCHLHIPFELAHQCAHTGLVGCG